MLKLKCLCTAGTLENRLTVTLSVYLCVCVCVCVCAGVSVIDAASKS